VAPTARAGVASGVLGGVLPAQNERAQAGQQGQQGQQQFASGPRQAVPYGNASRAGIAARDAIAPAAAPPSPPPPPAPMRFDIRDRAFNTEAYSRIEDNPFKSVLDNPLATFSIDVDTASYANMRRFLNQNQLPPKDSVRIEELVNYFNYDYPSPNGPHPIGVYTEVAAAPWQPQHRLVRVGVKAKEIDMNRRPASNLVFLIDVSGSMDSPQKLPLVKSALKLLVDQLTENDRVAIVVYAGGTGMVLPPTTGDKKQAIIQTFDRLEAGGSTNGAGGIQLAYETAVANFVRGGVNRVVLCTDGDFNVGITNQGDLTRLIEDKARSGVFLSVLGFGMGNLKDSTMEQLADKGNGNYAYVDSLNEARKVLVEEMGGTLMTVAKDVKIQVDFNPAQVSQYRLIGYENRALRNEDFNDDTKDAGDMGSGHTVTALFEIVPPGAALPLSKVDESKYRQPVAAAPAADRRSTNNEMLTVRVRYKLPDAADSTRFDVPLVDRKASFEAASPDYRFAAAVAEFGMILRESPYRAQASLDQVVSIAERSKGADRNGYREEFIGLARRARGLRDLR
jgi:Ca-activated chloride channel family protein